MTELTPDVVRFGFAGLYALTFALGVVLYRRTPRAVRTQAAAALAVVGVGAPVILLQEFGLGEIAVGNGSLDLVAIAQGLFSTVVVYGLVLASARVSRRLAAATIGIALVPTMSAEIVAVAGEEPGVLVLVAFLAAFFLPFPVLLYLFTGPIWRSAEEATAQQRLLHWKARNVLLFAYGMLLAYTPLVLTGLLTDPVLDVLIQEYSVFFLYGGIVLYLLYNYSTLATEEATDVARYAARLVRSEDATG